MVSADTVSCIRICKVVAIDEDARTVDVEPIDEDAPVLGVNLQANQKSRLGIVAYPKVGSWVTVGIIDNVCGIVLLTDEVEKYEVVVGDMSIVASEEGIVMNGGTLGGMVKVEDLVIRLNLIEEDINKLKTAIEGWVPVAQDGGSALKAAVTSWSGATLIMSSRDDVENTKVKQ